MARASGEGQKHAEAGAAAGIFAKDLTAVELDQARGSGQANADPPFFFGGQWLK